MARLTTAKEVVVALNGVAAVCAMTGRDLKTVYHWTGRAKAFPARYYDMMTKALRKNGHTASPDLWKQQAKAKNAA